MVGGEGPFGIILCPSRELARQTFDVVDYFCKYLHRGGFPELRSVLCIGESQKRLSLCWVIHLYEFGDETRVEMFFTNHYGSLTQCWCLSGPSDV